MENEKKEVDVIKYIIIALVAGVIIFLIIAAIISANENAIKEEKKKEENSKLRNFATERMKLEYDNVYADLVLIEPKYCITSNIKDSKGLTTYRYATNIICKCETVEGNTIWVSFTQDNFPLDNKMLLDWYLQFKILEPIEYSSDNPLKVYGTVTSSQAFSGEFSEIDKSFVLSITTVTNEPDQK